MKRSLSIAWESRFQSEFGFKVGFVDVVDFSVASESFPGVVLLDATSLQNASTSKEYPGIPGGICWN